MNCCTSKRIKNTLLLFQAALLALLLLPVIAQAQTPLERYVDDRNQNKDGVNQSFSLPGREGNVSASARNDEQRESAETIPIEAELAENRNRRY